MSSTLTVLHDPANGPLPGMLAHLTSPVVTDFHGQPDGMFCARCNRHSSRHIWQAVDEAVTPVQGGVIDCGVRP